MAMRCMGIIHVKVMFGGKANDGESLNVHVREKPSTYILPVRTYTRAKDYKWFCQAMPALLDEIQGLLARNLDELIPLNYRQLRQKRARGDNKSASPSLLKPTPKTLLKAKGVAMKGVHFLANIVPRRSRFALNQSGYTAQSTYTVLQYGTVTLSPVSMEAKSPRKPSPDFLPSVSSKHVHDAADVISLVDDGDAEDGSHTLDSTEPSGTLLMVEDTPVLDFPLTLEIYKPGAEPPKGYMKAKTLKSMGFVSSGKKLDPADSKREDVITTVSLSRKRKPRKQTIACQDPLSEEEDLFASPKATDGCTIPKSKAKGCNRIKKGRNETNQDVATLILSEEEDLFSPPLK